MAKRPSGPVKADLPMSSTLTRTCSSGAPVLASSTWPDSVTAAAAGAAAAAAVIASAHTAVANQSCDRSANRCSWGESTFARFPKKIDGTPLAQQHGAGGLYIYGREP